MRIGKAGSGILQATAQSLYISRSGSINPFVCDDAETMPEVQSYSLLAVRLKSVISITASTGFEISTDNDTYSSTLELPKNWNGTVYVRLNVETAGYKQGTITHESEDADDVVIAVSASVGAISIGLNGAAILGWDDSTNAIIYNEVA